MKIRTAMDWFFLTPLPVSWRVAVFAMSGVVLGMAVLVVHISRATSYLPDDPTACINCHVMEPAYAGWRNSSHATEATCNDCHLPHQNPVAKLARKARDGTRHTYVFTFRLEPQVIHLASSAVSVVQENCLRCHHDQLQMIRLAGVAERRCWDCHQSPHGPVTGLSSAPDARRPDLPPAGFRRHLRTSEPRE